MHGLQYVIGGQFLVASLIGLAALCLFVWAAAGLLTDVEPVKYQVLARGPEPARARGRRPLQRDERGSGTVIETLAI